jgi:hypothetical protein
MRLKYFKRSAVIFVSRIIPQSGGRYARGPVFAGSKILFGLLFD